MRIKVRVTPRATLHEVIKLSDGTLRVKLKSPPVKGKANRELIEVLASYYKVPRDRVSIVSGFTRPQKIVEIEEEP